MGLDVPGHGGGLTSRAPAVRMPWRRLGVAWWEVAVAAAATLAAVAAVWVTLDAGFLAHPWWLAVQKADIIVGPVFVGLYWMRVRPRSRFGPLLIGVGFVNAGYVAQSSDAPWLFGAGVMWEAVIYVANLALILTFPSGRMRGLAPKLILAAGVVLVAVPYVAALSLAPQIGPDGSIAGCRALCPENGLAIASRPQLAVDLVRVDRVMTVLVAFATAVLLVWRMLRGTPAQRRAHTIGASVALVFTVLQIAYQVLNLLQTDAATLQSVVQWAMAAARSLVWYGFLAALISAQLFAGRVLHRLVRQSLRRPSKGELEAILREPLGDPDLRLVFRDAEHAAAPPGRAVTVVERDGREAVAILHDAQLDDDPELLQAAGAVALLAAENAELDAATNRALDDLRGSRARVVTAADDERRKLERDLHDGVQQRLVAIRMQLALAGELSDVPATRDRLDRLGTSVQAAIDELRGVAHGLYPPLLREQGLVAALERVAHHTQAPIAFSGTDVGRFAAETESAIYYCCLEAIQNATKHGGRAVRVAVTFRRDADAVGFAVADDGLGFDPSEARGGTGIQNMRDRLGALDGQLSIETGPARGTVVSGSVPLRTPASASAGR
jgi:signal transduction histidine kinase